MQRRPRRIEPSDLALLVVIMDAQADTYSGARLRAIVTLAHAAALDLSEVLAVQLRHVINERAAHRWTVSAPCYVPTRHQQTAIVPAEAARALAGWINAARLAGSIHWPPARGALLFHNDDGRPLSPRTVQAQFAALQLAAGTAARYRFSDLRHDAITRYAEATRNAGLVSQYARISERSALTYLPRAPRVSMADLAEHLPASAFRYDPVLD